CLLLCRHRCYLGPSGLSRGPVSSSCHSVTINRTGTSGCQAYLLLLWHLRLSHEGIL
ncbi:hypothetical protein BGX30_010402, partial [Mortierella sp. GBA39]